MQRVIKFRAWSKVSGSMSPAADFAEWLRQYQLQPEARPHTHFDPNRAVLMQFTGLHDKNGKQIYEGDVLQSREDLPKFKVEYSAPSFIIVNVKDDTDWVPRISGLYEVIGDIYRNPELLL